MPSRSIHEIPFHHHPVEDIEPLLERVSSYREAALKFKSVMEVAYHFVVTSDRPRMAMQQVGIALGLPTALKSSESELALLNQVTRQDFSKGVTKFLRMSQLPPALALKSEAQKAVYRNSHL
jgi:hypothetical protein